MPPPLLPPLALRIRRAIAHQTLQRNDFPEPLPGRFGKMAAPAPAGRNVVLDRTHRRDLGAVADMEMIVDSHLGAQRHIVADRQAAREPDLGREQAMPADGHIVTDLDLIVDFGAFADHGIAPTAAGHGGALAEPGTAQPAAVDGGARADLDVVLDQPPAGLRHFQMALRSEKDKTVAVL